MGSYAFAWTTAGLPHPSLLDCLKPARVPLLPQVEALLGLLSRQSGRKAREDCLW